LQNGDTSAWSHFVRSVNTRVARYARHRGHPDPDDVMGAAEVDDPDGELIETIVGLLALLDDERRAVIVKRYVDGSPTREIAARLGKSDEATHVIVSRSLEVLRREMQKTPPETDGVF